MSTRPRPYRPPRPVQTVPLAFALLFGDDFLDVRKADSHTWWNAGTQARWSDALALVGVFRLLGAEQHSRDYWLQVFREQLTPQRLVLVTELLVKEGRLCRDVASRVEECILAHTSPGGTWAHRGHALTH